MDMFEIKSLVNRMSLYLKWVANAFIVFCPVRTISEESAFLALCQQYPTSMCREFTVKIGITSIEFWFSKDGRPFLYLSCDIRVQSMTHGTVYNETMESAELQLYWVNAQYGFHKHFIHIPRIRRVIAGKSCFHTCPDTRMSRNCHL